jgi:two-component system, sensor histidine kinase PdtaS
MTFFDTNFALRKIQGITLIVFLLLFGTTSAAQASDTTLLRVEEAYNKNPNIQTLEQLVNAYFRVSKYDLAEKELLNYRKNSVESTRDYRLNLLFAKVYKFQKKKDLSMKFFFQTNKLLKIEGNVLVQLEFSIELIEFYRKFHEYDVALQEIDKTLKFIQKEAIRDPYWLGRFYNRYAAVMNETSQNQKAVDQSHKALYYSKMAGDKYAIATSYNELGFAHKHTGHSDSTLYYYNLSEDLFAQLAHYSEAMHVKLNKIEFIYHFMLYESLADLNTELFEILEVIERENLDYSKASIYSRIEDNYFGLGDYKKAHEYSIKLRHQAFLDGTADLEKSFQNIREQYENDKLKIENTVIQSKAKFEEEKRIDTQRKLFVIGLLLVVISLLSLVLYVLWLKIKSKNRQLIIQNKHKTFLVQEIHHRVKNNLQFVRSILKMQQRLKTVKTEDALQDVSRRIDAMSLVHEMLYLENDTMIVNVQEYFEKLMQLFDSMYNQNNKINIKADIEPLEFSLEKLVALGQISSELLANSVKHVFDVVDNPEFTIELKKHESGYKLKVFDNGAEVDNHKDTERVKLGMRLIDIFSRQVEGQYTINRESGYLFELVFP